MMDKIVCIGKNYEAHVKEMQKIAGDAPAEKPVLFLKPPSALMTAGLNGETIEVPLPKNRGSVHPECEIVLRIGADLKIEAVTVGLDLTLRDLQTELKKKGQPWEISKVFKGSAVVGPFINVRNFPKFLEEEFSFTVNGEKRQCARGRDMIYIAEKCVNYSEEYFELEAGDLIFTGTPAGVAAVKPGDHCEVKLGSVINYSVIFK